MSLSLDQKAARLHAQKPWLTHAAVMAELQARSVASRKAHAHPLGVLHVSNQDRQAHANVESPRSYWWDRD
jgi:hypothetical protein